MKLAISGDLHLSRYWQDRVVNKSHLPERLDSTIFSFLEVVSYCKKNDISNIALAGDIYHGKSIISNLAQNLFKEIIIRNKKIKFILIDGNHDLCSQREGSVSSLGVFSEYPNVFTCINGEAKEFDNGKILLLPYCNNLYDRIKEISNGKYDILISHFGLNEAQLSSGISIVSDIKLSDLVNKFKIVVLGHYHKPQMICNNNIKLWYCGSLIQLDWGEQGEEKRFLILDTDTNEVISIPTTKYKKYVKFDLSNNDDIVTITNQARLLQEEGHHVIINKLDKEVDISTMQKEFSVVDKSEKDITDRGINIDMNEGQRLIKYFQLQGFNEEIVSLCVETAKNIISRCSDKEEGNMR